MAWSDLLAGVALFLVIEGLFPFAAPQAWRRSIAAIGRWEDSHLRTLGLALVVIGLLLLYFVRGQA